ncbi:MAG TPA: metallophosphoesterase family protein [Polyangiales bacterium]|nr:metallophosphoesterase family protein [Polyangiales bacterium]
MSPTRAIPASEPMAFLSDVHGNTAALEAVIDELQRRAVKDVFIAGDLLLGGTAPLDAWRAIQRIGARCVCGPSDVALARVDAKLLKPQDDEEAEKVRAFAAAQKALGELVLKRLSQLPRQLRLPMIDGRELLVVHGSPKDPFESISHDMEEEELRDMLADDPADIVVCGGTHVPFSRVIDEVQLINVGSVGSAPEGRFAHYTIISPLAAGATFEQNFVEY